VTDQKNPTPRRKRLPSTFYNLISIIGTAIAGISLALIIFMMALEYFADSHSPYVGIIAFLILPAFLVVGLAIAAVGVIRQNRRRRLGLPSTEQLPKIDFNNPTHFRATVLVGGGFIIFLALTAFGSYQAFEYTESDAFCGTVCHVEMKPEYTAYSVSPHARVGCVKCHIGSGAEWFVKAKISGLYQVYAVLFDKVPRPIETPIENLRPSRDTCEQCHWPAHFYNEKLVVHDYFGYEEDNMHWKLHLLMKIGGGGEDGPAKGIHWHMNISNTIEYVATDQKRLDIPWVKSVGPDGAEKIYRSVESDLSDEDLAGYKTRKMDCIDCHNRPTHHYNPPAKLVNRAMTLEHVSRDLPDIKWLLVELMGEEYETTEEAMAAIEDGVNKHYAEDHPDLVESRAEDIADAIAVAQRLFSTNIFPEMMVSWREFPDHIGHLTTPGCFRCHDGLHETESGEVLSRDCNICHTIVAQERKTGETLVSLDSVEYVHPEDIDGEWKETNCSECHGE
jgi:hypothetical protein